jgi:hypothetical protein
MSQLLRRLLMHRGVVTPVALAVMAGILTLFAGLAWLELRPRGILGASGLVREFSPDSRILVLHDGHGRITFYDTRTLERLRLAHGLSRPHDPYVRTGNSQPKNKRYSTMGCRLRQAPQGISGLQRGPLTTQILA